MIKSTRAASERVLKRFKLLLVGSIVYTIAFHLLDLWSTSKFDISQEGHPIVKFMVYRTTLELSEIWFVMIAIKLLGSLVAVVFALWWLRSCGQQGVPLIVLKNECEARHFGRCGLGKRLFRVLCISVGFGALYPSLSYPLIVIHNICSETALHHGLCPVSDGFIFSEWHHLVRWASIFIFGGLVYAIGRTGGDLVARKSPFGAD